MELFNTSGFSSKNDDALRDFELDVSSKKKAVKRCGVPQPCGTHPINDPAWDDDSAFPEVSSKKDFEVGDRVLLKGTEATGTVAEIDDKGIGRIAWDIPQLWHNPGAKDDICTTYFKKIKCTNLIFVQESALDSVMPACNSDLTSLELPKLTITAQIFSQSDTQEYTIMGTCDRFQDVQPLVTHSIRTLQKSPSIESSTSTQSPDNPIPENFLEETEPQREAVPERKGRQRKGCLYKYIEKKKLKDGTVASYPRVIGHRDPCNPTHWRWGFNWEEKLDGEWKNRSLSVKLGAIPLIQSMQKEGVKLEEIIAFIKRSKSK